MAEVLCIGEALLVLTPSDETSLRWATTYTSSVAGAECNTAIALAHRGRAQSAPFPGLDFIATGGLTVLDVAVYRAAGCLAIAVSDRNIPQEWRASPGSARGRAGR